MPSSRLGLTLVAVLVSGVILAATAVAAVQVQRNTLETSLDADLQMRAAQIELSMAGGILTEEVADPRSDDRLVQIVDILDRVVASSPNLEGSPPIADWTPGRRTVDSLPFTDARYRVVTIETTRTDEPFIVHVGASYEAVADAAAILTRFLLVAGSALTLIFGGLAWVLVGLAQRSSAATPETSTAR